MLGRTTEASVPLASHEEKVLLKVVSIININSRESAFYTGQGTVPEGDSRTTPRMGTLPIRVFKIVFAVMLPSYSKYLYSVRMRTLSPRRCP